MRYVLTTIAVVFCLVVAFFEGCQYGKTLCVGIRADMPTIPVISVTTNPRWDADKGEWVYDKAEP